MAMEWLAQASTLKSLGLLIFFVTFCLLLLWVHVNKDRLENQKNIPFLDDEHEQEAKD